MIFLFHNFQWLIMLIFRMCFCSTVFWFYVQVNMGMAHATAAVLPWKLLCVAEELCVTRTCLLKMF
uniref:Uncharacterized protein n=1 Tax=Anguilla anguilla TaxID=7936 RepID=A0A0E9XCG1_ANGAN